MRKDHEAEEDWVAEAQVTFSGAAESEFARLKLDLKRKAGLLPLPLRTRVYNSMAAILVRLKGLWH